MCRHVYNWNIVDYDDKQPNTMQHEHIRIKKKTNKLLVCLGLCKVLYFWNRHCIIFCPFKRRYWDYTILGQISIHLKLYLFDTSNCCCWHLYGEWWLRDIYNILFNFRRYRNYFTPEDTGWDLLVHVAHVLNAFKY